MREWEIGAVENIHGALPYIRFAPILALVGVGVNRIGKVYVMPLPKPEPGLVLSYGYLWKWQDKIGGDTGDKNRPCVIVLSAENNDGDTVVMVVPVTSQQPRADRGSVEIPARVQAHLGLDGEQCWVIIDEVNRFIWPGPDLSQIPGQPGKFHYGFIPPKLYNKIIVGCATMAKARQLSSVTRKV